MDEMMMDETGMNSVERHEQSVKRVRSLCDMHRVPCGEIKDLDELIATIRENRHFAMDFWALVGDLSARERGTFSDDEMLEVVVEASAGLQVSSVPHAQRAKVEQLRQLLAGVDVGRPADLPDPISEPEDALLAVYRNKDRDKARFTKPGPPVVVLPDRVAGTMRVGARVRLTGTDDAWVARRSIGEALSRLERTSTELREQLAAIDEQLVEEKAESAVAANVGDAAPIETEAETTIEPGAEASVSEAEIARDPHATEPAQVEHRRLVPEPREVVRQPNHISQPNHIISREQKPVSVESSEAIAAREILMRALESRKETQNVGPESGSSAWSRQAGPVNTRTDAESLRAREIGKPATESSRSARQNEMDREAEVFAPRALHTLSQRGLATPREDEGPPATVPLSRYAREVSRRSGRGVAVAAVLLVILALTGGGAFFFLKTESGQDAAAKLGPALREQYDGFVVRLGALKREASGNNSSTTSENEPVVKPAPEATTATVPTNGSTSTTRNSTQGIATPAQPAAPPVAPADNRLPMQPSRQNTAAATPNVDTNATTSDPASRREREPVAARSRGVEPLTEPTGEGLVADANTVRVPASVMEANLVASRVPAYPEAAKAEGIQGPVVMETVISRSGTVDHVRVIEGDRQLRSAAEEAVLKWRFRPYFVNGQPVDVVTMVRVEFRLGSGSSR